VDLIFHLGLTKTGSSFLQHKVFDGKIRTLDRSVGYDQDVDYARQFQDFFLKSDHAAWQSEAGHAWFDTLKSENDTSALISHESLYDHIPFVASEARLSREPDLLGQRLAWIRDYCWPHGNVKAFFFFRRQPDWFASIYSHVAYRLNSASQHHFESSVRDILAGESPGAHVVDYSHLYDGLSRALGHDNVLALPYEVFSDSASWKKIAQFSNLPINIDLIPFSDTSVNTKRQAQAGTWMPATKVTRLGRTRISRTVQNVLPKTLGQELRKKIKATFQAKWSISMPGELQDEIRHYYAASNRRVSDICGVDLAEHGYFPTDASDKSDV